MKNAMQYVRAMASGSCFGKIRYCPSARLARIAITIAITIAINNDLAMIWAMIWAMLSHSLTNIR